MRVYGRTTDELGNKSWVVIQTDSAGNNEYVYVTALVQVLKLNLGESPFYGNFGIPARQSVMQQLAPDFYVAFIQSQYSQYFASLIIYKAAAVFPPRPTYNISVLMTTGTKFQVAIDGETVPFPPAPYPVNTIIPSLTAR
jgi:hypothetical protein